jgi:hypothetical protein
VPVTGCDDSGYWQSSPEGGRYLRVGPAQETRTKSVARALWEGGLDKQPERPPDNYGWHRVLGTARQPRHPPRIIALLGAGAGHWQDGEVGRVHPPGGQRGESDGEGRTIPQSHPRIYVLIFVAEGDRDRVNELGRRNPNNVV